MDNEVRIAQLRQQISEERRLTELARAEGSRIRERTGALDPAERDRLLSLTHLGEGILRKREAAERQDSAKAEKTARLVEDADLLAKTSMGAWVLRRHFGTDQVDTIRRRHGEF